MASAETAIEDSGRRERPIEATPGAGGVHAFAIAGTPALADPSGALYLPDAGALVVADLHLEKGSAYAARGQLLPPYDMAATLARLARCLLRYRPRMVVALGDSFHDARAGERITATDRAALVELMADMDWVWIAGNHDPEIPSGLGEVRAEAQIGGLVLRHEPGAGAVYGEIAGHLHPAARVVSPSGSLRRRCFVSDGTRCILPAFGTFTGGLNFRSPAFAGLFGNAPVTALVLHREAVYAVPETNCAGD